MFNAIMTMARTTAKTAALAAFLGFGALASAPAVAHADGVYLNFGRHHDPRFGIYTGDRDDRRDWRRDRRHDRHHRRSCTARQALEKARYMGLRRARVIDEGRRTIRVAGRKYNDGVTVVFGKARGCPIVYR
jgi:hypothetical protein